MFMRPVYMFMGSFYIFMRPVYMFKGSFYMFMGSFYTFMRPIYMFMGPFYIFMRPIYMLMGALHTESPDYLLCLSSLYNWEGYLGGGDLLMESSYMFMRPVYMFLTLVNMFVRPFYMFMRPVCMFMTLVYIFVRPFYMLMRPIYMFMRHKEYNVGAFSTIHMYMCCKRTHNQSLFIMQSSGRSALRLMHSAQNFSAKDGRGCGVWSSKIYSVVGLHVTKTKIKEILWLCLNVYVVLCVFPYE